ncbi:MAG: uroporphyrinogen-III C-methyltransferase [Burkholderiales bacterium]
MVGTVYLVGAGPGAPDLITLRGADLLRRADIVFHDALVHPGTLAMADRARLVAVGKRCGVYSTAQRFINKQLVDAARRYACVVRLKGGDPMLFGRAQEEISALQVAGIEVEVVPGVSAALAASAELRVSLTRRGVSRNVSFATPRVGEGEGASNWAGGASAADTAVLYMAAGQAGDIARTLEARGMPLSTPVVVVENASLPTVRQIGTTLGGLQNADLALSGPALLMIGEVYREKLTELAAHYTLPRSHAMLGVG